MIAIIAKTRTRHQVNHEVYESFAYQRAVSDMIRLAQFKNGGLVIA